jgi:hypothetical protein
MTDATIHQTQELFQIEHFLLVEFCLDLMNHILNGKLALLPFQTDIQKVYP